ncbi:MAG: neutral/alkaline non-lysosomal ceramidase N-terminal domain-containing protein [Clostridia bacterium]|nr:neutral/alkaline non-lysosomal ceramidase N-terminal domain-containing protein [Clostridia bacterium]
MFKVGFYEKEVTPPLGFQIPGYFNVRLASGVKSRLYAKAMVVSNGKETVAIAGVDGLLPPRDLRTEFEKRFREYSDIPPENVLLFVNHTHTGLPLKNKDATEDEIAYWKLLVYLISDCIVLAQQRMEDAEISFGRGTVEGISFVRDYFMKNTTPTTNPEGQDPNIIGPAEDIDPDLPVLFVKSVSGKPLGALMCFACHQDCVSGEEYCADFSGVAAEGMKKTYGNDFVTLFMEGTAGNINHRDVSKKVPAAYHYEQMGQHIYAEALRTIAYSKELSGDFVGAKMEYIYMNPTEIAQEDIDNARHIIATVEPDENGKIDANGSEQYYLKMAQRLITFIENRADHYDVPVQVIRIGDYILYGFPSEIFSTFGKIIKEKTPVKNYTIATLCNISYGYVPARDMFYPTIYESKPGANLLTHEAGYIMADKLIEMAQSLTDGASPIPTKEGR